MLRFSPTADLLVGLDYNRVTVWSLPAGEVLQTFDLTFRIWDDFVLLSDGRTLLCGGKDKTLALYDLRSGKLTESLTVSGNSVRCAAANADGTRLAVADSDENLILYDLQNRRTLVIEDKETCFSLAFSPDGLLAAGYGDVRFFRIGEAKLQPLGRCDVRGPSSVEEMHFSPDGKRFIATDGMQHQADYYRLDRSQEERAIPTAAGEYMVALAASRDGQRLAWYNRKSLSLRSTDDGKTVVVPLKQDGYVSSQRLEFSPDGTRLILFNKLSHYSDVSVFAVPTLELQCSWNSERGHCENVCFAPAVNTLMILTDYGATSWDLATDKAAKEETKLEGGRGQIIAGPEPRIITFDERSQVRVYSWPQAELLKNWHAGHEIGGYALSPDGTTAATYYGGDKRVLVWSIERGELLHELAADANGVLAAAFSADGRWLLTAGRDKLLKVWSTADGQLRAACPGHANDTDLIATVPGSTQFYTCSRSPHYSGAASVKAWDLAKLLERIPPPPATSTQPAPPPPFTGGQFVHDFSACDNSPAGFFDQDRKLFGLDGLDQLTVYDATNYAELWKVDVGEAEWVDFSPDGRWYAASYGDDYEAFVKDATKGATVKIWDAATRKLHKTLTLDVPVVSRIAFSPDGKRLAVAAGTVGFDSRGDVTLWDVAAGTRIKKLPIEESRMTHVAFSPDGTLLAYGGFDSHLNIWHLPEDRSYCRHKLAERVEDLRFSPDGKYVAACGGDNGRGEVAVYDTATGTRRPWPAGMKEETSAVAFSPRGDLLMVACFNEKREHSYRFFHLPDGKEVRRLVPESASWTDGVIAFSADGARFIENAFGNLKIWRLDHLFNEPLQRDLRRLKDRKLWVKYHDDELELEFSYGEANDRELQNLPVIGVPFQLKISSDGVSDAGIAHLARQQNLIGLDLEGCEKLTAASLTHLKGLPLRSLTAPDCKLADDAAVAAIGELTTLEKLTTATPYDRLESLDLAPLSRLKQLRELRFEPYTGPGAALRHLAELTKLEVLCFESSEVTDEDFRHLGDLKRLRTFEMRSNYEFTGTGLKHLTGCAALEVLRLDSCGKVDDAGIAVVSGFKRLRELSLDGTAVTDAGLAAVAGLTALEQIELPEAVSDLGLAHLANLTRLRGLELRQQAITDRGLQHLARLTALEELQFGELKQVTGAGLAVFAGATKLKQLNLSPLRGLTDDGLGGLGRLTQLEELWLPAKITDSGLLHLSSLTNLVMLDLDDAHLTDAGLAALAKLTNLKTLRLENVPLTDDAIPQLTAIRNLSHLVIEGTKISPAGKKRIEASFPKENHLYVSGP